MTAALTGLLLAAWTPLASPMASPVAGPVVSIVVDDLGDRLKRAAQVVELPGPVVCAVLPRSPHARRVAEMAHRRGKEVIVHLPMETVGDEALGPAGLRADMVRGRFVAGLRASLNRVPHAIGASNHMGSLLTQRHRPMRWLMQELARKNRLFLDSRTTAATVAERQAERAGIDFVRRDVFLDQPSGREAVERALGHLAREARRRGYAVGVAHPGAATLAVLRARLPRLTEAEGVRLVGLRQLLARERAQRVPFKQVLPWQAFSFRWPTAARSSKP